MVTDIRKQLIAEILSAAKPGWIRAESSWGKRSKTSKGTMTPTSKNKSEIMYVEAKPGITGPARIGRVHSSKTGRTI